MMREIKSIFKGFLRNYVRTHWLRMFIVTMSRHIAIKWHALERAKNLEHSMHHTKHKSVHVFDLLIHAT